MRRRTRQAVAVLGAAAIVGIGYMLVIAGGPARRAPLAAFRGPARTLPAGLLGFNGEAFTADSRIWADARFVSAVAALRPESIRVFGGTPANFWDWRAGGFVTASELPPSLRRLRATVRLRLADWAAIVRATHAIPVFDLNVVTSDLRSQIGLLTAARRLGMPVRRVELGNELYLDRYGRRFPDGAAYGRLANRWIAALHSRFPGAEVAVSAFPGADSNTASPTSRERSWNGELLRTVHGASAVSLHVYFASGLDTSGALARPGGAARMLRAPQTRFAQLKGLIQRLPARLAAWVTEWNLFDRAAPVHATWAQGLDVAQFGLELLTSPRVSQADYHALVNSAPFGALLGSGGLATAAEAGSPRVRPGGEERRVPRLFALEAGGVAMKALLGSLAGARTVRPLDFGSVQAPSAWGAEFDGGAGRQAVILNLSSRQATIALPPPLRGGRYRELSAAPDRLVTGQASLRSQEGTASQELRLTPYSLTTVSV